jgi:cytochrome c oxidase subunit 3
MSAAVWNSPPRDHQGRTPPAGVGLWVFICVASVLFALFLIAYVIRMASADWSPIAMPWQLWLSTVLLIAGSVLLQGAKRAGVVRRDRAHSLLLAGGTCALAFVCSQLWAWQSLQEARVLMAGNPAASFFYLLTAMHGLHVIGGLVAWSVTAQSASSLEPVRMAWRIRLCARYWHFLLVLWVALFAAISWLTPELARFICGVN